MNVIGKHPNKNSWKIPVRLDAKGNIVDIAYSFYWNNEEALKKGFVEIENVIFDAVLKLEGVYRGRSSTQFHWIDVATGCRYTSGPQTTMEIINAMLSEEVEIHKGHIKGTFTFIKQGSELFITLYKGK